MKTTHTINKNNYPLAHTQYNTNMKWKLKTKMKTRKRRSRRNTLVHIARWKDRQTHRQIDWFNARSFVQSLIERKKHNKTVMRRMWMTYDCMYVCKYTGVCVCVCVFIWMLGRMVKMEWMNGWLSVGYDFLLLTGWLVGWLVIVWNTKKQKKI